MGHPHGYDLVARHFRDLFSFKKNLSRAGRNQAGDRVEDRRLTGAVGSDQRHNLPLIYFKGNPLDGLDDAIVYFQIADFKHCHSFSHPPLLFAQIRLDDFRIVQHLAGGSLC